ncbi:MAG TPA: glycosyltransferase family 4 protein [Oculatellaceae cyanobacterium]|jgi:glycosyltransferase involved in cell wall biosynthesis
MLSIGDCPPSTMTVRPIRRIRVGMVLDQPFPPDARVEREAVALTEAGYEVHLLCMLRPEDTLRDEFYRGFYIHRVDPNAVTWELPFLRLQTRLPYKGLIKSYFYNFKNIDTTWYTLIDRFVQSYQLHVLHVHDLRLVTTGLAVTEKYGVRLVADLHENYPALMQMMKGRDNPKRGLRQRHRWEAVEANCAERAHQVIVVTQEAKERLVAKGVPAGKILVVENTVDVEKFIAAPIDPEIVRQFKPYFLLCYVGHLNDMHRGIQTVIDALAIIRDELPEVHFVGAGAIREPYRQKLEAMIANAGLHGRVHFTGWLDETEFSSYIEASDICLCPHLANDHTNATFPNKVYLYHLFKKPVIVSNAVPLQRYAEDTQGGLVFESGNAQMLADRLRELYYQPNLRKELAFNGHQAVMERYNWKLTAQNLVSAYNALCGRRWAPVVAPQPV